jgi:hypothetical protein
MAKKENKIVDVLEQPDYYRVAASGNFPRGSNLVLRFPNGNTFTFDVAKGRLLQQHTPAAPLAGPVNPD